MARPGRTSAPGHRRLMSRTLLPMPLPSWVQNGSIVFPAKSKCSSNVNITKGTENGNAELSDNTINLYDTMMDAEEVEQRERETTREVPLGTLLAQTGDMLPILGIGAIVLASLIALIVAARRRRHEERSDD